MEILTPALKVIRAAGGAVELAKLLRVHYTWVWRWTKPRIKGGTEGMVPQNHHKRILALSREFGWGITAADLIG